MKKAVYALSADPITYGHMDIIQRASKMFDELIVAVGYNSHKNYLFSQEERVEMTKEVLNNLKNVKVVGFTGLLVDFAFEHGVKVIVKGVRNQADLDYETMFRRLGEAQKLDLEAVLLPASPGLSHVSSSGVKMLQKEQGFVYEHVPLAIKQKLERRLSNQYIIGVTGQIGTGKSFLSNKLQTVLEQQGVKTVYINMDLLGHQIISDESFDGYKNIQNEIKEAFNLDKNLQIDRKELGKIVFGNKEKMQTLNRIMYKPLTVKLRKELHKKEGVIIVDSALLAEFDLLHVCNNNVILTHSDKDKQIERLQKNRSLTVEEIQKRIKSQLDTEQKVELIIQQIKKDNYGKLLEVDTNQDIDDETVAQTVDWVLKRLQYK